MKRILSLLFVLVIGADSVCANVKPHLRITSPYPDALMQYSERLGWYMMAKRGGGIIPVGKKLKIYARVERDNRQNSKILCRIRLLNAAGMVYDEKFLRPEGSRNKKISHITSLNKGFNKLTIIASMQDKPFHWLSDTVTIYEALDPVAMAGFKIPSDTNLKQFDIAEKQLKILNRKNPNDPKAHYYLGHLYYREGDWTKAVYEMKLAAKYAPDNPAIHNDLGKLYHYNRVYDLAGKSFERAAELKPAVYEFQKNIAVNSYLRGDRAGALKHIDVLIGMTPEDQKLYQLAGVMALEMGDKKRGIQYLRKYLYYMKKKQAQSSKK